MKRTIIQIDSEKCDGCGLCVTACHEGAIELRDGKAVLAKEQHCDGLGDCIGECPRGAIGFVERDAPAFVPPPAVEVPKPDCGCDAKPQMPFPMLQGGCPGSRIRIPENKAPSMPTGSAGLPARVQAPDLSQWPVQLHLVPLQAPFFADRELVVMATCAPVASADVHWRFLRGRSVVIACPKLDRIEPYVEKLAGIFAQNRIPKVLVVRMSVPCCGGLTRIVQEAWSRSGRTDLVVEEVNVDLDGSVLGTRPLQVM